MQHPRESIRISSERITQLNALLMDPGNQTIGRLFEIVDRFGGPGEINRKASEARKLSTILSRLKASGSAYLSDVEWLAAQRDKQAFISMDAYYARILGEGAGRSDVNQHNAVTLEISALQFFPWLIAEAKRAIEKKDLMPGRFIRVRNMKEQTEDNGDTLAVAAAMQVIGASYVETLDTRGTDGSNVHLGGPETITGYFGGIGQPNDYPFKWVEEYLHYYTTYGIRQVLNVNSGTILAGYLLHKMGVDIEFKISVYAGIDNPLGILWTLMTARLFAREDGTVPLIGFNLSNSVNNWTLREAARIRRSLDLEAIVRFEHHITETQKSIVRQPYNRRDELVEVAKDVANIAAKHEGGDPELDAARKHPSDILDYFLTKEEILARGMMADLLQNYLDKHDAVNRTAEALVRSGTGVVCAQHLHKS